jgi:ribosomal protein S18 acetylase RimI-like enzyme
MPSLVGVACWVVPEDGQITYWRLVQTGLLAFPARLWLATLRRMCDCESYASGLRERYAPHPHWYLWGLGVLPSQQGNGVGTALLRMGTTQADEEGLACYLETHKTENVAFYARRGFQVAYEGELPGNGPPVWAMIREPH